MTQIDRDLLPVGFVVRLLQRAVVVLCVFCVVFVVLDAHGYDRVSPPLIEFESSLAARMSGIEPRRMFRFVDPVSLRMLALRSDITPQIGRIAETGLAGAPRPLRLAYAGHVATLAAA